MKEEKFDWIRPDHCKRGASAATVKAGANDEQSTDKSDSDNNSFECVSIKLVF